VQRIDERRTVKTRTTLLAAALAVLLLAVAAVASGCGSASASDEGVAALDESATTSTTEDEDANGETTEEDPQEAALAWAKCMREQGVDVPDPEVGEGGRLTIRPGMGSGQRLDDADSDAFREAMQECGRPFGRSGPPALSDEEREEMQETMLEFAQCMREHGVDMPDPDFSGEGGGGLFRFRSGNGAGGVNPDGSTFREAQEACGEILEDALPGPPGGPAGAASEGEDS
jgi:hypothetical protein